MRMSSRDEENLSLIYECFVLKEDMDAGGVTGGGDSDTEFDNEDEYAPGDSRIPFIFGRIQTRGGSTKRKKKRKKRRDTGVPRMSASISDIGPLGS